MAPEETTGLTKEEAVKDVEAVVAKIARIPPKSVSTDDKQVLLNLIINAEQAMLGAHGRGTLVLRSVGSSPPITFVRNEAVISSQIEGTQSSLSGLLLFELGEAPGVPLDDVAEVARWMICCAAGLPCAAAVNTCGQSPRPAAFPAVAMAVPERAMTMMVVMRGPSSRTTTMTSICPR